ncbi:MAG: tRNA(Ile)-lysidine synthase [Firmicutes bacterium]|nr:tRNA(Ile)-lysidine synthase [Bacillota bacterium]
MLEKVKCYCDQNGLLKQGDTILVACSGGPDSLALVDVLLKLKEAYQIEISVAHFDHMFRGAESQADAAFVAEFCNKNKIDYYQKTFDVPAYIKKTGLSPEEAARIVRYDFLREVAKSLGNASIATGHHKDDQAETVLIHLFRGAGSSGIGGIRPISHGIIRPLLSVTRQEIEEYCQNSQLVPRIDSTNAEPYYLRNRIRLQLLPELMEKFNPAIKDALCKSAEIIGAEHEFIRQSVEVIWQDLIFQEDEAVVFNREKLNRLHIAQKRELFRIAIEKKQGHLRGISFMHVEKMIVLSEKGFVGTHIELPGNLIFKCSYQQMILSVAQGSGEKPDNLHVMLDLQGDTYIPELNLTVQGELTDSLMNPSGINSVVFDFEQLVPPLFIRFRQTGDRFHPSGMEGSKKLKDFFIDCKVERQKRDTVPLLCDQRGILWISGYRQSVFGRVSEKTKKFLRVSIRED